MSLRESFTDQAQKDAVAAAEKLKNDSSKELQKIADKLPRNLKKHVKDNGVERELWQHTHHVNTFVQQGGDVETLDGYKRLQEVCASPEMDMKLGFEQREYENFGLGYGSENRYETYCVVTITPNRPYSDSRPPFIVSSKGKKAQTEEIDNTLRDSLLELPGEKLRALLAKIREERPEDFRAAANPAELRQALRATPPLGSLRK